MNSPVIRPNYHCGLSGLELPIPKYQYPEEFQSYSRLQYYATFYNSIEVNSSFYKIPRSITLMKWALSVGDTFRFTFKLFQGITHAKPFTVNEADTLTFLKAICPVRKSTGCLLIQFPPSFKASNIGELDRLLELIRTQEEGRELPVAVEVRDKSWYEDSTFEMLERHGATLVIHDKAAVASPRIPITADFVYLRFHGPSGNYRGSYSNDFLYEYAGYIHEWLLEGKTVYVYFNNTMGDAFNNLHTLNTYLKEF